MNESNFSREIVTGEFVQIVKQRGKVWASPLHTVKHPNHVSCHAILEWQYDSQKKVLFAISENNKRVEVSLAMPAFKIYLPRETWAVGV